MFLAHSKNEDLGIPSQTYSNHINGVVDGCEKRIASYLEGIDKKLFLIIKKVILLAAEYHDLGKLDEQSQKILSGKENGRMINHVQAGVTHLLNLYQKENKLEYLIAAYVVHAHHIGYEDREDLIKFKKSKNFFDLPNIEITEKFFDKRPISLFGFDSQISVQDHVNQNLSIYLEIHNSLIKKPDYNFAVCQKEARKILNKFFHMKVLISILCDSDHADTCKNYGGIQPENFKNRLRAKERMEKLISTVKNKKKDKLTGNELIRQNIRDKMFKSCSSPQEKECYISLINGLVGSGKTFSLMAKALATAEKYNAKNIFIVLPYIALIEQSYQEYANAISLNEKDELWNINVIHSMANYNSAYSMAFAKTFLSAISLTTSVNFFETIIANNTGRMSNIYKFTNSVICIDEYHAIAEHQDWALFSEIISEMKDFNCRFILSSGTPVHYWDMNFCSLKENDIEYSISDQLYREQIILEKSRVKNQFVSKNKKGLNKITYDELFNLVKNKEGSLFVVFNTKKRAARFFDILNNKDPRCSFLRTSALTVSDREKQLEKVKRKLNQGEKIILVVTQGSDIGLDLSFDHSFKELSDFNSINQTNGRVNRGSEKKNSSTNIFKLSEYPHGNKERILGNIQNQYKSNVLEYNEIYHDLCPSKCTDVVDLEIETLDRDKINKAIQAKQKYLNLNFRWIEENYKMIPSKTVRVLVDKSMYQKLKNGEVLPFRQIQRSSVQIYLSEKKEKQLDKLLVKVKLYEEQEIYCWLGQYDHNNYGIMYAIDTEYQYEINLKNA